MSILQRVPWVSLTLLILSYSTLGWVISETKAHWSVWLVTVVGILLLMLSLTTPWASIRKLSSILFKSNTSSFIFTVFAAFLFFLMLAWFRLFLDTLLIVSAAILARIDFQAAGFKEGQTFWITAIFSLAGLALGVGMRILFFHQIFIR
jgi:hypothetical protein